MSDFSLIGGGAEALAVGYNYAATKGTVITGAGTANTKGAYVEILTAANNIVNSTGLCVILGTQGNVLTSRMLVDIAIGGAGSEVVIIPNLFESPQNNSSTIKQSLFTFPVQIPSGVRISIRCQGSLANAIINAHIIRFTSSLSQDSGLSVVESIGANLASSDGTTVARAAINTFGSWVEISSSLPESLKGFVVSAIRAASSWGQNNTITYEVGTGSAGNEETIFSGQHLITNTNEVGYGHSSAFIPVGLQSGSRISIRAQANIADPDNDLDYIIYGVR